MDLIVTSPPYFGLRSYTDNNEHYPDQIGSESTPVEFVQSLIECTEEMIRVLKPSGSLWVNLGDKYAGGGGQWDKDERPDPHKRRAASGSIPTHGKTYGLKPKSLIGLPWRYALRCIDDLDLILRAEVIWNKRNALPESVKDRVRRSHEQWFHFVLQPHYYSAIDEIREEYDTADRKGPRKSYTPGSSSSYRLDGGHEAMTGSFAGLPLNPLGKLPGSVWEIATQPLRVPEELKVDHFAAFPMEWPRRLIKGFSPREVCTACGEGRRPVSTKTADNTGYAHGPGGKRLKSGEAEKHDVHRGSLAEVARWKHTITGYACACPDTSADSTPGVVLDPFGGTGTTALVASMHGRQGISIDLSHDYNRIAEWRCNDPKQRAKAAGITQPKKSKTKPNPSTEVNDAGPEDH